MIYPYQKKPKLPDSTIIQVFYVHVLVILIVLLIIIIMKIG